MQIENFKSKILDMELLEETYLADREKLAELYSMGVIDESGRHIIKRRDEEMKE